MKVFCSLLFLFFFSFSAAYAKSPVHVESVQADFIQEKNLPILARPLFSTGRFLFQAADSLRWEYFSPLPSVLLMDHGQVRKFVKNNDVFTEEQGMGLDAMQVVLQEITGWLDGEITDTATFHAERRDEKTIVLTPKKPAFAKIISRIVLIVVDESGLMESVTIHEGENSFTRMVFTNSVLNTTIPAARFTTP